MHMIAMSEAHARAAVEAFAGFAQRLVVISSGDEELGYREPVATDDAIRATLEWERSTC